MKGDEIPLPARILGLAQTVEVFHSSFGIHTAYDIAVARRGTWFDPELVEALLSIRHDRGFWAAVASRDPLPHVQKLEPEDQVIMAGPEQLDTVAEAFANVIDAKSPWTFEHSNGVADVAVAMGARLGMRETELVELRRAALLHDLGKLGVSSLILDKPGALTAEEFAAMRRHPRFTRDILTRVGCFASLVDVAASHHERLDGSGYHRRLNRERLPMAARVLCVADICDALRASRPYREGLPVERVIDIVGREANTGLDPDCVDAMRQVLLDGYASTAEAATPAVRAVPDLAEDYRQAA
jgi:HD-GYP domain-containing protein (c-di-GMP phosphodiesterase class II)